MPCKEWNDGWVARLYDELDPVQQRALEAHLEGCAECRTTLAELDASRQLLREAAPEVPASPRVVVLRPRPFWSGAWSFAAGAACALILFGAGFAAGPRWTRVDPAATQVEPRPAEVAAQPVSSDDTQADTTAALQSDLQALHERLVRLEKRPAVESLNPTELEQALEAFERRLDRERSQDLEYVMRSITASELRTGTWMDQTEEALAMLALRQDPRFAER